MINTCVCLPLFILVGLSQHLCWHVQIIFVHYLFCVSFIVCLEILCHITFWVFVLVLTSAWLLLRDMTFNWLIYKLASGDIKWRYKGDISSIEFLFKWLILLLYFDKILSFFPIDIWIFSIWWFMVKSWILMHQGSFILW